MDALRSKIVAMLRGLWNPTASKSDRRRCPDDETMARYLSGGLAIADRSRFDDHLATCNFCVEEVVAGYRAVQAGEAAPAPRWLVERAMTLVPAQESFFDLSVRLLRDSLELIATSGRVVPLLRPVMRGQAQPVDTNALQVEQKVGRFKIAVEIDVGDSNACQVITSVAEESGAPADGVRLTLNSGDREQASFLTRAGVVVFDRIAPGEYSIAVSESDTLVGKIRVNLMMAR